MKTNSWCQINDFLFIWKGNWEQINDFGWGGGGREVGGVGEKKILKYFSHGNFWDYKKKKKGANKQFLFTLLAFINTKYLAFTNP